MERVRDMRRFTIKCLMKPKTGCHEAEGRKKVTARVIRLSLALPRPNYYLGFAEVEEYEV